MNLQSTLEIAVNRFFYKNKNELIVGPYLGEFGWELMEWIPRLRGLAKLFKKTTVFTYNSSVPAYGDEFIVIPHDRDLKDSGFGLGNRSRSEYLDLLKAMAIDAELDIKKSLLLTPADFTSRINQALIGRKIYEPFLNFDGKNFTFVFHFRNFERVPSENKSYPLEYANHISRWCNDSGYKIAAIGHPELSYCPSGCEDLRSLDLKIAISTIRSSAIMVGGSSAPLHLGALCKKPLVTWIGGGADIERYFTYWNPFESKVWVVTDKTFIPRPDDVIKVLKLALQDMDL